MPTSAGIRAAALCVDGDVQRAGSSTGVLAGLRFAVKDLFDVAGRTAGCGNPDWLRTHAPAEHDAPCVAALLSAGATLDGITLMDELAYSLAGKNAHYGAPINPAAPDCICGGSSSGSASMVAGGLVDFALGTDTGGSVRIPASYCGLYGLRPTHDRIPLKGLVPLAPSFDTIGWFARDSQMLQRVGKVLLPAFTAAALPGRLLLPTDAFAELDDLSQQQLAPRVERVQRALGLSTTEVTLAPDGFAPLYWAFRRIQAREVWQCHGDWLEGEKPKFGPGVRERFMAAKELSREQGHLAQDAAVRTGFSQHLEQLLADGGLLLMPAAAGPPPRLDTPNEALEDFRDRTLRLTCPAGLAGVPQLSLPAAHVEGRPVGLSLCAARNGDEQLLAVAEALANY